MKFRIRQQADFYLLDFSGIVNKDFIIGAYSSLLKQNNFNIESQTLWDFRKSVVNLSINDINQIAQTVTSAGEQRSDRARSAFIVIDPSDTAILQTYITATAHYPVEFKIFDNYQSGSAWLKE